ncbi:MAG: M28 family peptidase [Acidobacteriota bacterium]|nr:M28 family peptidase [Acidobacteriota bacterium]
MLIRTLRTRRFRLPLLVSLLLCAALVSGPVDADEPPSISTADMQRWLGYIASDELQGREVFTEGLGLAAAYIADHLARWNVTPGGDDGTYFQTVKILGVRSTSKASVLVEVNGTKRIFRDGEGIAFPKKMGGKQTIQSDRIQFVGYGLQVPSADLDDYSDADPRGKVVVFLGQGPATLPAGSSRLVTARSRNAISKGAIATIGPSSTQTSSSRPARDVTAGADASQREGDASARRTSAPTPDNGDFTTAERYDRPVPAALTATDEFFEFLFSGSDVKYAELKEKVARREPLPRLALKGVSITVNVDADYAVVRTRLTRNVVGTVRGRDAALGDTYVAFGAHYDHIGYVERGGGAAASAGAFAGSCPGQTRETPRAGDIINNGADDDGSGTVALMALARAYAEGPRPKRSLLFVWHSGEEAGLHGSRYYADFPIVPLERISAQLNIDMIGRNRCDDPVQGDTVYLVGSDRISTELHNLSEDANGALARPLTLDYALNDPADPESIYTRSDHYSYASKGVPIIFYTTGLHRDYHYVTDEVSKIDFAKLARITQLIYATGTRLANLDHAPVRDNKGPRRGRGAGGRIER